MHKQVENKNSEEGGVTPVGASKFYKQVKINVPNDSHWTMIYRSWSQNNITVFDSLLERKCTPGLMIAG